MSLLLLGAEQNYAAGTVVSMLKNLDVPPNSPDRMMRISLSVTNGELVDAWSIALLIDALAIKLDVSPSFIITTEPDVQLDGA